MIKLITLLASGIPAVIAALIAFIARKAGTATASIAAFVVITLGFIACINSILQSVLGMVSIPGWISNAVGLFVPVDFAACVAAYASSRICRAAYDMAVLKVKLINSAS